MRFPRPQAPGPPFTHILLVDSFEPKYMYLERKTSSMKSLCVGLKSAPHWEVEGLQIPLQGGPVAQWTLSGMGLVPSLTPHAVLLSSVLGGSLTTMTRVLPPAVCTRLWTLRTQLPPPQVNTKPFDLLLQQASFCSL